MSCLLQVLIFAHEPLGRDIPQDDGKQDRRVLPSSAGDLPSGSLRACWQSSWPSSRVQHRAGSRLVVGPLLQWIGDDQATNSRPAELWPAAGDCHRRNRWRCSAAGGPPASCFSWSTESGIPSVPPKRVSIASFQAWSKASPASSCLLEK